MAPSRVHLVGMATLQATLDHRDFAVLAIQQNVSNTAGASYVPTKMEIDITLIPVQTRTQVSKQFSLKGFANGQLLKGGFW